MSQWLNSYSKLKYENRKRSESKFEQSSKLFELDPKPGDLAMSRLKIE